MKMIFVVFDLDGKHYAIASTIRTGQNLCAYLKRYNSTICHLCESAKQAELIAYKWNQSYKANGTALF